MEKAKLFVREGNRKKIIADVQFADGKKMSVPKWDLKNTGLDATEVEVERHKGQIVLIKNADGQVLFPVESSLTSSQPKHRIDNSIFPYVENQKKHFPEETKTVKNGSFVHDWQLDHVSHVRNPANAPYNFVPLNREVVAVDIPPPPFEENRYYTNRNNANIYTGRIEIEIEALTPLYIRDSKDKPDFCAPVGKIRIPGSSLRGMVRNMVEMVSFGRFHYFDDKRLYYRGLADSSNLRNEYRSRMSSSDSKSKSSTYKMSAGYLIKDGSRYGIIPAQTLDGNQFKRIKKEETKRRLMLAKPLIFENYTFFEYKESYVVISGHMQNKKHDWEINPSDKSAKIVWLDENNDYDDQSDVENYYLDRNRNAVNLIKELEKNRILNLPCFYVQWVDDKERKRVSFGHTAMFRLAYEKTIGDHLPKQLKDRDKIDFTDAIFGNEKTFAGRVFFDDAFLAAPQSHPEFETEVALKILSTPKPTTFQHYLVQSNDEVRQLNHYNSKTALRGYKVYWHKSGETKHWVKMNDSNIGKNAKLETEIKPINPGTKFHGSIRFENFSGKELGAMLFALDLPVSCGHKLGMGKSLGLGSIRISPVLYLSNRSQRYNYFFAEWDNKIAPLDDAKLKGMKCEFEQHVLDKLIEKKVVDEKTTRLWETDRLRELLVMLRVDVGRELEKIGANNYMTIEPRNEFKNRYVLPNASHVAPLSILEDALVELRNEPTPNDKKVIGGELEPVAEEDSESGKAIGEISYINKVEIKGLWDTFHIDWPVDEHVSVLVGINGSGKSTILELINHALADKYDKPGVVVYPPQEFTIIFDNGEKLSYQRTENGINCLAKPQHRLLPEYISTFDAPLELEGTKEDETETTAGQIEKQLTSRLSERIDRFFAETKALLSIGIDPTPFVEEFVQIVNEEVFFMTKKKIEFVGEIKFTPERLGQFLNANDVPPELRDKLEALVSDEAHKLDKEFPWFIESKLGKYNSSRLRPQILQYAEFMQTCAHSQAIFHLADGRVLMPDQLSAGEKAMLIILLTALILKLRTIVSKDRRYVMILDEPENSLHLKWQKFLISYIHRLNEDLQIIIATHAPAVIKKGYMQNTVEMNQIKLPMEF